MPNKNYRVEMKMFAILLKYPTTVKVFSPYFHVQDLEYIPMSGVRMHS